MAASTPYTARVSNTAPLAEYPRPQLVRPVFQSLNGPWQYAFTETDERPAGWQGEILVPFPPESPLSGVGKTLMPDGFLWYRRAFVLSPGLMKSRLLLHFGAVDQTCTVYVNGMEAGRHEGGFLPFTLDITRFLRGNEGEISLCVQDKTDTVPAARGAQSLAPGQGVPVSGIWQTVWLESVPKNYIRRLCITPLYDEGEVEFLVENGGDGELEGDIQIFARATLSGGGRFRAGVPVRIPLPGAISWHPGQPFLYTVRVAAGEDRAESYFGMRKFSLEADGEGRPRLMLNNKPFVGRGLLDTGLYSDGLYTPPTDAAMQADLKYARQCGFNMLRKQGKIEPMRWYHHCDRLGLLVWQDLPAGGGGAKPGLLERLLPGKIHPKDSRYARFGREDEAAREAFLRDADETARLLGGVPSVCGWVLFSEGKGQFDAAALAARMKQNAPAQWVDHAACGFDQGAGDIRSLHGALPPLPPAADGTPRADVFTAAALPGVPADGEGPASALPAALEEVYPAYAALLRAGFSGVFFGPLSGRPGMPRALLSYNRREEKLKPRWLAPLNEALGKA